MNEIIETGGYVTSWSKAYQFKPKDMELILVHYKDADENFYRVARYYADDNYVLFDGMYPMKFSKVDYWMRIPPFPRRIE